jgi:4-hydroxy-3-polyprenylbenzoate decarboxylase
VKFKDLREFIKALEVTGDVVHIKKEVDWDEEAGAVNRRAYEMNGPALLFDRIKGYPEGYRIFAGSLGTYRRVAIAMGLPPETSVKEIFAEYEKRTERPIKPTVINKAPCKENILLGNDVDLYKLPAPMVHTGDGGRYIGTWDLVVCKDPDTNWTNWGMYRFMVYNKRYLTGFPRLNSHFGMILHQKYIPLKKSMPVALVIGADPISHLVASASLRKEVNEADVAGGLLQEPVELIRCETNDLLVPAHAEIVVEGEVLPDLTGQEGPFGEYPGYRTEGIRMGVTCRVTAITFRNSPILTMISLGVPPDDNSVATPIASALAVKKVLQRHGIPVVDVYSPPHAVLHTLIVSVAQGGREIADKILDAITLRRSDWNKVIIVDNDIDIFDLGQVLHAFSVKCHPLNGVIIRQIGPGKAHPLTPCYTAKERREMSGGIVAFDCTWPPEWSRETDVPTRNSFADIYSSEIQDKILKNWTDYGLKSKT